MSSGQFVSLVSCALALAACKRPSEPPPGPSTSAPDAPSSSAVSTAGTTNQGSVHDHDMPDQPPPRPASDNATLIKASHILIAYKGALDAALDAAPNVTRDKEAAKKLANFVGIEARTGAEFASLVAQYSDDPQAKANDGRLGQISRTQMAKPFTDAAFGLMVKEITVDPVETAYGFHIIKRTE